MAMAGEQKRRIVARHIIIEVLDAAARAEGFASYWDTDWEIEGFNELLESVVQHLAEAAQA